MNNNLLVLLFSTIAVAVLLIDGIVGLLKENTV
jgi:hypothetical protein